jgi:hypothetical protein
MRRKNPKRDRPGNGAPSWAMANKDEKLAVNKKNRQRERKEMNEDEHSTHN